MRIAIYHELAFGGALRTAEAFAVELAKHHDVVLFAMGDQGSAHLSGVTIRHVPFSSPEPHGILQRIQHDFIDVARLRSCSLKVAAQINAGGFDVAFVHPSRWTQAPFLLSQLKIPSLYYAQEALRIVYDDRLSDIGSLPILNRCYEYCNRYWRKCIDARNIAHASRIVVNSRFTRDNIRKAYGLDSYVCHLGVNTALFHRQTIAKRYDVLFFGSPVVEEGFDIFTAALALSPTDWKVKTLQRGLDGKGVSDVMLVRLINQSKIAVSLEHHHPFGINMIEAGACGVPVVAVREGGYLDSVQSGKTGLLVRRDPKAIERAVNTLLTHDKLREQMGQIAHTRVANYWTWEKSALRLEKHVHALVLKKPDDGIKKFVAYVGWTSIAFIVFRVVFHWVRSFFKAPTVEAGVVGFAQYNGYPLGFETMYFNLMFLTPIVIAYCFAYWYGRRQA